MRAMAELRLIALGDWIAEGESVEECCVASISKDKIKAQSETECSVRGCRREGDGSVMLSQS